MRHDLLVTALSPRYLHLVSLRSIGTFQSSKLSRSSTRIDCTSEKRGVIMQSKGGERLYTRINGVPSRSTRSTHLMMPISKNALVSGGSLFPFLSCAHLSVAAHRILAVCMKSESFARCLPTQARRPNPNDT